MLIVAILNFVTDVPVRLVTITFVCFAKVLEGFESQSHVTDSDNFEKDVSLLCSHKFIFAKEYNIER